MPPSKTPCCSRCDQEQYGGQQQQNQDIFQQYMGGTSALRSGLQQGAGAVVNAGSAVAGMAAS